MTDWIGKAFTSDLGWSHLETLVDIGNRMAGTDGEHLAAEETRDILEEVGARNVRLDPFDIQGWTRGSSSVETGSATQECIALPRSPSGTVTGELVDVGYGLPEDFETDLRGKIVMAKSNVPSWYDRFIHRREKYYYAVEAGAVAFVFRNHVEGCLAPTGSVGTEESPIGEIPAVGVSKEVGARLARRSTGEDVTVSVDVEVHEATSANVHADLGPETTEELLVTSHVDAHDIAEGAADNGAGTALVCEVVSALLENEAELDTRIHVIVYGAEEVGLCGSTYDSSRRDHDSIKAIVNNDGVVRGRNLKCYANGFDELVSAANTLANRFGHEIVSTPELAPHSDHWPYVERGVPGYHLMSQTTDEGRGWGHTRADTLDKLDVRDLRTQSILIAELVKYLASESVEIAHRDPASIADQLEDEDLAEGMKVIGDWPY